LSSTGSTPAWTPLFPARFARSERCLQELLSMSLSGFRVVRVHTVTLTVVHIGGVDAIVPAGFSARPPWRFRSSARTQWTTSGRVADKG